MDTPTASRPQHLPAAEVSAASARRLSTFANSTWEPRGYQSGNAYCGHAFVDDTVRPSGATAAGRTPAR